MNVAVLLSGGVDSSVALHLAKQQGASSITAYYLKIWLEDEVSFLGECPWEDDLSFAREVCLQAGVELRIVPLQTEYYDRVVSYALDELGKGRTPSPDIFCNERIKFGAFFDALDPDIDKVVTGHYARVVEDENGQFHLLQAPDPVKDQSYFLSHLNQAQLSRLWFPLGEYHKTQVRELARKLELPNMHRKDSQGICFLGKIKYPDFVRHYLGEKEGAIIRKETGEVLGTHKGYWFHTIGQRSGLGLGNGPWYVSAKDPSDNIVYVTHADDLAQSFHTRFFCTELYWASGEAPAWLGRENPDGLHLKLRHGAKMTACRIERAAEDRLLVTLEEGDKGLAEGQFAVFYRGNELIGSGTIDGIAEAITEQAEATDQKDRRSAS